MMEQAVSFYIYGMRRSISWISKYSMLLKSCIHQILIICSSECSIEKLYASAYTKDRHLLFKSKTECSLLIVVSGEVKGSAFSIYTFIVKRRIHVITAGYKDAVKVFPKRFCGIEILYGGKEQGSSSSLYDHVDIVRSRPLKVLIWSRNTHIYSPMGGRKYVAGDSDDRFLHKMFSPFCGNIDKMYSLLLSCKPLYKNNIQHYIL